MHQVLLDVFEVRLGRVAARVTLLGVGLTLGGALVLGLGLWNVDQARELEQARQRGIRTQAALDSLRAAHDALKLRLQESAERVGDLGRRMRHDGLRSSELVAIRGWIRRLESRIDGNEGRLGTMEGQLEHGLLGAQDSVVASQAPFEASVDAGFSSAERARATPGERHSALERKVGYLEQCDRSRAWRRAAPAVGDVRHRSASQPGERNVLPLRSPGWRRDAFRAAQDFGFGVRVGSEERPPLAAVRLPSCEAVIEFLDAWQRAVRGAGSVHEPRGAGAHA